MKSARLSFKGYTFKEALARNKDAIKVILGILGAINFATLDWKVLLITLGAAMAGLAVKLIADAVDFYFTEVDL